MVNPRKIHESLSFEDSEPLLEPTTIAFRFELIPND